MNMCSRSSKLVPCDANDTCGYTCHEPWECDIQSVNKVAQVLSKSLRIEILEDSADVEDGLVDEAQNGQTNYVSSSSPGSTFLSEEWSDKCNEGLALNFIDSFKASNFAQEAAPINVPSSLTVVSALKGSREKQGIACSKLSISWSPDVYDPVPTIVSHTVKYNQKRHCKADKKSGKKGKHKGSKGSKQSAGKDRKQSHKSSSNAKNCHTALAEHDKMLSFEHHSANFDVGNPEFFANSFLKHSLIKVQMPATKAL